MSLLTIGGYNNTNSSNNGNEPLKDITNQLETPRSVSHKKINHQNHDLSYAPKKSHTNESPPSSTLNTQFSVSGKRLQFEDENTLQTINLKGTTGTGRRLSTEGIPPPSDIHDRSKCIRKKIHTEKYQDTESHSTPQKKIPLLFGSNVTVDSPDPLSKYNVQAPAEKSRSNQIITSLTRVLQETKLEHSPDSVIDDIYDFTPPNRTLITTTSKYKGSTISEVIRGNLIEECEAEYQQQQQQQSSFSSASSVGGASLHKDSSNSQLLEQENILFTPKNCINDDEDKLFQQMTSHRKKKSTTPLQPLSSSLDGPYFTPRPHTRGNEKQNVVNGKSIDSALSSLIDNSQTITSSHSSNELLTIRPTPPPSAPPANKRFSRPIPPSSSQSSSSSSQSSSSNPSSSSFFSTSSSLSTLELSPSVNSITLQAHPATANATALGKSRPLCGRKYSMAPKSSKSPPGNESDQRLEDSLESFTIPQVDSSTTTTSTTSTSTTNNKTETLSTTSNRDTRTPTASSRRVLTSGVSRRAMHYLLLQANKKRRKRGKAPHPSSSSFKPNFESIPEDTIPTFPTIANFPWGSVRMESFMTAFPEYISWMIDEYMRFDEDDERKEKEKKSSNSDSDSNSDSTSTPTLPTHSIEYDEIETPDDEEAYEAYEEYEKKLFFDSIKNYNIKIFKEIISRNPRCISYRDERGNTPLLMATIVGWRKAIKILIKHGSDLNSQNLKGNTCSHYAFILPNYSDIQRYLFRKKADFSLVNEKNYTCKCQYRMPIPGKK